MSRSPRLAVRRVQQTLRFPNGPKVLLDLVASRSPWAPDALAFKLRNGQVVHCPNVPGARVPVYEVFAEDCYRFDELLEGLPAAPVVLDIGGHIGCFSLGLAEASKTARIHTYEASPSTASWLQKNVESNSLADRVTVHHSAVSSEPGMLEFADNAGGSSLNGLTAPEGSTTLVKVPAVTFDDAVAEAGGHVDLVKIDVEGAEYGIFSGTTTASWEGVQRVVMEYHDVPGHDLTELLEVLFAAGLRLVRVEPVNDRQGTVWLTRAA